MKMVCVHCAQVGIELTPEQLTLATLDCLCQICRAKSYYRQCQKCKKHHFFRAPAQFCPNCR